MIKQVITSSAKSNQVVTEWVEDPMPEWVDWDVEIAECKQMLAQTDYVALKIAEGVACKEEYADILAKREAIRRRINELENMQNA